MMPPIYTLIINDTQAKAALTTGNKTRFFAFGEAGDNPKVPYATYQFTGEPENSLGCTAPADTYSVQVDVWHKSQADLIAVAKKVRNAVEKGAYMTFFDSDYDAESKQYRYIMRFDFIEDR